MECFMLAGIAGVIDPDLLELRKLVEFIGWDNRLIAWRIPRRARR